jgi:hypothetical protein
MANVRYSFDLTIMLTALFYQYSPNAMERALLSSPNIRSHVYLMHDYVDDPNEMLRARSRADSWANILMSITA